MLSLSKLLKFLVGTGWYNLGGVSLALGRKTTSCIRQMSLIQLISNLPSFKVPGEKAAPPYPSRSVTAHGNLTCIFQTRKPIRTGPLLF